MDTNQKTKDLLDPLVDVFACGDGGVAFAILRHSMLPEMLEVEGNSQIIEIVRAIEIVSRLCKNLLNRS